MLDSILHQTIVKEVAGWIPRFFSALVILLFFIIVAYSLVAVVNRFARHHPPHRQPIFLVIATTIRLSILAIGIITAMGSAGVNVSALVASLGLSSLALGFALKDALSNLCAGTMVILYQPFKIGDNIQVENFSGTVTKMSLRYTHLRDGNREILIPNASLLTNHIVINQP